jgi:hypothetical protein
MKVKTSVFAMVPLPCAPALGDLTKAPPPPPVPGGGKPAIFGGRGTINPILSELKLGSARRTQESTHATASWTANTMWTWPKISIWAGVGALIVSLWLFGQSLSLTANALGAEGCPRVLAEQLRGQAAACRLLREGRLTSALGNAAVVYRLYRWVSTHEGPPSPLYDAPPYNQTAVTLSVAGTSADEAFWGAYSWLGEGWFEAPAIVRNARYGEFLVVRGRLTGTGSMIDDRVLMPTLVGGWQAIDVDQIDQETGKGWTAALMAYLPEGLHIVKGILVDYATLTGETALWRTDDANCCPSGGRLWFQLQLTEPGPGLEVAEARYTPQAD